MTIGKIENWSDIRELVLMSIGTDKGRWWAYPEFGSELLQAQKSLSSRLRNTKLRCHLKPRLSRGKAGSIFTLH